MQPVHGDDSADASADDLNFFSWADSAEASACRLNLPSPFFLVGSAKRPPQWEGLRAGAAAELASATLSGSAIGGGCHRLSALYNCTRRLLIVWGGLVGGLIQPIGGSSRALFVEFSCTYRFIGIGAVEVEDNNNGRLNMKPEVDGSAFKPTSAPWAYTLDLVVHNSHSVGADAAANAGEDGRSEKTHLSLKRPW